ncbi:hypothetical protein Tsubulata_044772 [Turnera subulata]|uniref:Protein kinase domain-containing protein n=1 Tax=Turnera subulata TaxID=218843 RepID=A0A9Q0JNC3_9ROSI|nr:hypothetical protein Tsubulata_044772 [Turnera subulata]
MDPAPIRVLLTMTFLIFPILSSSEQDNVKQSLLQFMFKLSAGNAPNNQNWGWNSSSDPCSGKWMGVECDKSSNTVKRIVLEHLNFTGTFDASSICQVQTLNVLSLSGNNIFGSIPQDIGNCKRLTHFYISRNLFSGSLPDSLSQLSNLKRLDISNNDFSGELPPGLSRISGLLSFFGQENQLSGAIPEFHFSNVVEFNVSNNNLSGPVPDVKGKFGADSFSGNPLLCGKPLLNPCLPSSPPSKPGSKHSHAVRFLIYSGYMLVVLVVLLLVSLKFLRRNKSKEGKINVDKKGPAARTNVQLSDSSSEHKAGGNRSEYSITSVEAGMVSSSLVVLKSPAKNGLKFEDLLRAPAELLGRGKHGSLYKVILDGAVLSVKRIRDWGISSDEFTHRMQAIDQVKHPRVLPPVAFYCSKQEKLLVYEYQPNGSLFSLLHGSQADGQVLDWASRLSIAAIVSEALAFMHDRLQDDRIAHGNLKSTNILFNKNMEPCISEYGLMVVQNQHQSFLPKSDSMKNNALRGAGAYSNFNIDVYSFGVILLELLTGKLVQNNGYDLASWVHSVVREEWTVEVFDRALVSECVSEERMVNLLQVALKCINPSPNERPSMSQIAAMINTLKEEDERSMISEPSLVFP